MPRKPRMYVARMPYHVIQRGNNHQDCFFSSSDRQHYLRYLYDGCRRYRVQVHAYVLMTNHVHLLLTPEDKDGISRVIQSLGRRYVQSVNARYQRSGTLWEGRHKSSIVHADRYLLACYRYIELNPVRAAMVEGPGEYRWSSYRHNAEGTSDPLISEHSAYRALGRSPEVRAQRYREMFQCSLGSKELHAIRNAARSSMPLGDARFKAEVAAHLGMSLGHGRRGRPKSTNSSNCE